MAGFGRYGPYVEHDGKYVKIDADEVFTIGQNRAVTVIAEGNAAAQGRAARTSTPIKVLGEHPELGGKIEVLSGRFGPYIKFGKVNATVPKSTAPEAVTLEEAVRLIAAKMESGGSKTKARGKAKPSQNRRRRTGTGTASSLPPRSRKLRQRRHQQKRQARLPSPCRARKKVWT